MERNGAKCELDVEDDTFNDYEDVQGTFQHLFISVLVNRVHVFCLFCVYV